MTRAQSGITSSRNALLDQQNRLLESLNDPNLPLGRDWEIVPVDRPVLTYQALDYGDSLKAAMRRRPEIIAQQIRVDTAGIAVGVAHNQVLPRLDVFVLQETTGAGSAEHSAWDRQWHNDTINYSAGLTFEVPLGNRAAQAGLRRRRAEQRQANAQLDSIEEQVLADVRISLDGMKHAHEEIGSSRETALAESRTLQAYRAQTEAETGTTPGFLDRTLRAQERMANALLQLAQDINRYNIAIMDSQRARGTLLQYDNIKIAEQSMPR